MLRAPDQRHCTGSARDGHLGPISGLFEDTLEVDALSVTNETDPAAEAVNHRFAAGVPAGRWDRDASYFSRGLFASRRTRRDVCDGARVDGARVHRAARRRPARRRRDRRHRDRRWHRPRASRQRNASSRALASTITGRNETDGAPLTGAPLANVCDRATRDLYAVLGDEVDGTEATNVVARD